MGSEGVRAWSSAFLQPRVDLKNKAAKIIRRPRILSNSSRLEQVEKSIVSLASK